MLHLTFVGTFVKSVFLYVLNESIFRRLSSARSKILALTLVENFQSFAKDTLDGLPCSKYNSSNFFYL